ncbi:MAG: RluA family pseudouridine synthase [Chitinophagales bacterium]|nr:RluA family pseudouridine synthase [Chitinophagales bacterium]
MHELDILYEDNHLIAVNKPATILVQGDITGDVHLVDLVKEYLRVKYDKKGNVFCGLIHRLDRPTSGVVVLAKTSKALQRMNNLFKERMVRKTYWAVVKGIPEEQEMTITNYLKKDQKANKSKAFNKEMPFTKQASLSYRVLGMIDNYSLLEIEPKTGRHHQIRVQLSSIGKPIKGDLKYGFSRSNADGSIHLHARKLSFTHPVSNLEIEIKADPPSKDKVWQELIKVI